MIAGKSMKNKIDELEQILILMAKYKVSAVKVGDIEVAGVQFESPNLDETTNDEEESEDDILFHSAN